MSPEDVKFQKSKSIDIGKKHGHFYVCMHHGSVWIHEFTKRFCEHFTCLSYQIQIAIKLENISNWIASLSSYTSNKNNCKHEGQFVMKCISNTDFHL
jgi:hypothetical protein